MQRQPIVSRETLWQRRLEAEARMFRPWRSDKRQPPRRDSLLVTAFRALLRLSGLYNRGVRNANSPVLRRFALSFAQLPSAFDGFRILLLSDLHFRDATGFAEIVRDLLRGTAVDLCLLAGDFRYSSRVAPETVYRAMATALSGVETEHGLVGVLGNNDPGDIVEGFRKLGIRVLVNENLALVKGTDRIWIAGVDDPHEFRCDSLECAMQGIPPGAFTILAAHSPEIAAEAAAAGVDLYLCGHTHGGQICLPRLGPIILNTRCPRAYAAGPWRRGDLEGYTTTGIGTSTVHVRLACPPEAVILELKRSSQRLA